MTAKRKPREPKCHCMSKGHAPEYGDHAPRCAWVASQKRKVKR